MKKHGPPCIFGYRAAFCVVIRNKTASQTLCAYCKKLTGSVIMERTLDGLSPRPCFGAALTTEVHMKKKTFIVIAAIVIIIIAAVIALVLIGGSDADKTPVGGELGITVNSSVSGVEAVSADNIAGIFVEDGSDEALESIAALTLRNTADKTLQYAGLVLTADGEEYHFEVTTVPAGGTVRVMEADRKSFSSGLGECSLSADNIAWFDAEPSMYEGVFSVRTQEGALIITNESDTAVSAPVYVYYKNYVDGTYIGGITYRAVVQQDLEAGESAAVSAMHFDPESSRLMFITYVP